MTHKFKHEGSQQKGVLLKSSKAIVTCFPQESYYKYITYNTDFKINKKHHVFTKSFSPSAHTDLIKSPKYDLKVMTHGGVHQLN